MEPSEKFSSDSVPARHSEEKTQIEGDIDLEEDEISQQMTQSYSEISFRSGLSPEEIEIPMNSTLESLNLDEIKRPMTLPYNNPKPLNLEGSVHIEGNMTHFVAEEIEQKIRFVTNLICIA